MSEETQVTPEQTTEAETEVVSTPEASNESEYKAHPAHEKLLSELPEAWHQKVIPHLQEQDKYYQQQMEKYTPFKEYVEQGVTPEVILGGINLARAIETQPTEVYASLKDYLVGQGLLEEDAKQAAKTIMEEESGESLDDIFDDSEVPSALRKELKELKEFQAKQTEYMEKQELEKATAEYTVQLESEMATLRNNYSISDAHEVAIYDLMNAAINAGREISVADAAKQLQAMVGTFQKAGATSPDQPPMVVGSAGGAGIQAQNLSVPKDDKGKKAMMQQIFEDYKKANQNSI
jgi:hypothetical protein